MPRSTRSIPEVPFHNPRLSRVGVEVMTIEELRRRSLPTVGVAERLDFHLLACIQAGQAPHSVDFVEHALRPGALLFVRAGQVQRWQMRDGMQGQLVLISGHALTPLSASAVIDRELMALDHWPTLSFPSHRLWTETLDDTRRLRTEVERFGGNDVQAAVIRHTLLALLLRLARDMLATASDTTTQRDTKIYRLFAHELEKGFRKRQSVLDFASRIGYSESTLSRACMTTVGHSAKKAIDLRIALEAKRLLVHSEATVAQISHHLGFSEPSNFVKFFRRQSGVTPVAFRMKMTRG